MEITADCVFSSSVTIAPIIRPIPRPAIILPVKARADLYSIKNPTPNPGSKPPPTDRDALSVYRSFFILQLLDFLFPLYWEIPGISPDHQKHRCSHFTKHITACIWNSTSYTATIMVKISNPESRGVRNRHSGFRRCSGPCRKKQRVETEWMHLK